MRFYKLAAVAIASVLSVACADARFLRGSKAPVATQIPVSANLVTHFDAAATGFTNGQTVTAWTDTVNSIVAGTAVGTRPTLATNRLNSLPSVQCSTAGGLSIATPGALKTAIDSLDFTVFIVFRTLGSASFGSLFSATAGGDSFLYIADGTNVQKALAFSVPYAGQTSFSTLGSTSFNTVPVFGNSGFFQSFYVNGGAASSTTTAAIGTAGHAISICSDVGNTVPVNAEIFDILVWNTPLTPAQYMQAEMWACDKYAQPYPWAGLSSFNVFFGDSITQGVGASNVVHQAPYLAAQTKGLSFGQWHNVSVGGISVAHMDTLAPTWVDPIPALIGKKTNLIGFEWVNQSGQAPPGPFNNSQAYLANRKLIANQRTVWGTSTGVTSDPNADRNSYDTAFDGASTTNIDSYMSLHTDAQIGTPTAFAAHPANWSDTVHFSDTGYPFLATQFVNGINALP